MDAPFNQLGISNADLFSAACTTNMREFDLRQAQGRLLLLALRVGSLRRRNMSGVGGRPDSACAIEPAVAKAFISEELAGLLVNPLTNNVIWD